MNLNETIQQYFTRESIVDLLTRYELYYQISLGSYVFETIQDMDETVKKLRELNLLIEVDTALLNIFEILLHHSSDANFEDRFEYHLRSRALIHSLKDFVTKDSELLNAQEYIDQKTKEIVADTSFTESMKLQLESDYNSLYDIYDQMITQDVANKIQSNLK